MRQASAKWGQEAKLEVDREADEFDQILPPWNKLHKIANGFKFTEGPVWVPDGSYLLFSDPNNNMIYRLGSGSEIHPYITKSGYTGTDIGFDLPLQPFVKLIRFALSLLEHVVEIRKRFL